jgi:formylglycine-generating enzyme required for sulfatase activity
MSDGWAAAQAAGWDAPLYWRKHDDRWFQFGPGGLVPLPLNAPVRHVSWYEADAFARWSGARLPTEAEWEIAGANPDMREQYGHVWQWTESAYRPYPGYRPEKGAIGEYNGKFMINQMGRHRRRAGTRVRPTGTFSTRTSGGNSPAFDWPGTYNRRPTCQTIQGPCRAGCARMWRRPRSPASRRHRKPCRRNCFMTPRGAACSIGLQSCQNIT